MKERERLSSAVVETAAMAQNDRANVYQDITDAIIADLERGCVPWAQPWDAAVGSVPFTIPRNASTRRPYSGINILTLWSAAAKRKFTGHDWLTFRQALAGGSYFPTSQVIDLARGKPDCGFVYWVQAMGMARRSKAFCWRGVGGLRTVKGRSGAMAVTTVLRARVARSASRLWKLWTGAPSAVLPVAFLATARGERCALATGLSRNAAAASLSSSS